VERILWFTNALLDAKGKDVLGITIITTYLSMEWSGVIAIFAKGLFAD